MAGISDAAGAPAGFLDTAGTIQLSGFGKHDDRIIYAVYEAINSDGHYALLGSIGANAAVGRMTFQSGASGSAQMGTRFDTVDGSTNASTYVTTARSPGLHIIWAQTTGGMTGREIGADSPFMGAQGDLTPGEGMQTNPPLVLPGPQPSARPIAIVAYKGSHDELTRARVVRWLAAEYGVSVDDTGWPTEASRAADQVTLQVLPAPSYVRQFYALQASTLSPPAKPTTNPPEVPWSATEPSYTGGSTDTLYTVWLTAYGSVAHEYGDVQKSTSFEAAKAAWNKANAAQEAANTAYDRVGSALTIAGTKSKVLYSTSQASGTATVNDVWRRLPTAAEITAGASAGDVMQEWRYTANGWVEVKVSSTAIANLDVGKLTVGTGAISELVAQHLAARTGQFMQLGVDQLTAADAAISQAVIEKLWADVVKAKFLTVTEKIIANDIFAAGVVSAEALATDALNFKTAVGIDITGSSISGSVFNVIGQGETALWSFTDAMNTADSSWIARQFTQKTTVSSPVHSGTGAMRISTSVQPAWVRKTISPPSNAGGIAGSIWVWAPTSGTIVASISATTDPTYTPPPVVIPAATWTEVPLSYDSVTGNGRYVYLGLHHDNPPAYAVFDDLRLTSANKSNQSLVLQRNAQGVPSLTGFNSKGLTLEVRTDSPSEAGGAFIARRSSDGQSAYFDGNGVRLFKSAEWDLSDQLLRLTKDGLTFNKDASPLRSMVQSQSPQGLGVRVLTSDDSRAELVLDTWNTDIRLSPGKAAGPLANNGGKIVLDGPVHVQGDTVTSDRTLNVLWSGAPVYLRGNQVANLSESVSKQLAGIILVWSEYSNGSANNSGWVEYFVPKNMVAAHPGNGHTIGIRSAWGAECAKYAYVFDDRITGNDINQTAPNNTYVLRYVYGV